MGVRIAVSRLGGGGVGVELGQICGLRYVRGWEKS